MQAYNLMSLAKRPFLCSYPFSVMVACNLVIQCSTHLVFYSSSVLIIQCSNHLVFYSSSVLLIQCSNQCILIRASALLSCLCLQEQRGTDRMILTLQKKNCDHASSLSKAHLYKACDSADGSLEAGNPAIFFLLLFAFFSD